MDPVPDPVDSRRESVAAALALRPEPRPGRKRRNLPADAWRERVLQAARVVFADEGYEGASMEEIATLAGISRAGLYRQFPGRRDLFDAMIAEDATRLAGELLLEFAKLRTAEAKVRAVVSVFFGFVEARHERNRVFFASGAGGDPGVTESLRVVRAALAETLAQNLVRADVAADGRSSELRLVANGVIGLAEGAATSWLQGPHYDRDRAIEVVAGTALRALEPWI